MGKLIIKVDPAFFAEKVSVDANTPLMIFVGKLSHVTEKLKEEANRVVEQEHLQSQAVQEDEQEISRVCRFDQIKHLSKEQITLNSFKEGLKAANIQNTTVLDYIPLCILQNRANIIASIAVGVREFLQSFDPDNGVQIANPTDHKLSNNSLCFIQTGPNTTQMIFKLSLEYLPGFDNNGKLTAGNMSCIAEIANETLCVTFTALTIELDNIQTLNNKVGQGLTTLGFKPKNSLQESDVNETQNRVISSAATLSSDKDMSQQYFHLLPAYANRLGNVITATGSSSESLSISEPLIQAMESNDYAAASDECDSYQTLFSSSTLTNAIAINKQLIIMIDPAFYTADIKDSAAENCLRNLADPLNTAYQKIQEQYFGVKNDNEFLAKKYAAVTHEISRFGYRFDQIEGDVTLESFQNGLIKAGVNKENRKALDFLTLFVLQNQGEILFNTGNAILDFLNKLVKVDGLIKIEIGKFNFKQKKYEISGNHLISNITEFSGNILIKFSSFKDGSESNIGEVEVNAEINNDVLAVDFKSIKLVLHGNDRLVSQIETAIKKMGFVPSIGQISPAHTKQMPSSAYYHQRNEKIESNFHLKPFSLQQLKDLRKNPNKALVSIDYGFDVTNKDHPQHEKIGVPQNQFDRQKILVENAKNILNVIKQSSDHSPYKIESKLLTDKLDEALKILESLSGISQNEIDDRIKVLHSVAQSIHDSSIKTIIFADKCTAILEALSPVLDIFESSEGFLSKIRGVALGQFSTAFARLNKNIQQVYKPKQLAVTLKEKQRVETDSIQILSHDISRAIHNNSLSHHSSIEADINRAREELQIKVNYTFEKMEINNLSHATQVKKDTAADFISLSMKLRATIVWIERKQIEHYEIMTALKKRIDRSKQNKKSRVSEAELQQQLECYKKIYDYYDTTLKILRNQLGKLNCRFYTQDYDGKIIHPRSLFVSDSNNIDPLNASLDFMSYINFQAKKIFDGQQQQFSWIDNFLPWRWGLIQDKLQKDTKYHLNNIFNDNGKSPKRKFAIMKQKIAVNKPSMLNLFRFKERRMYQQLENQAYELCLLDAFGRGYMTETQLSQKLLQYAKEKAPPNSSQIKDYARLLKAKCEEYVMTVPVNTFKSLKQSLNQEELSSTAKACLLLRKEYKTASPQIIADVPKSVKKIIDASNSLVPKTKAAHSGDIIIPIESTAQEEAELDVAISVVRDRIYGFS